MVFGPAATKQLQQLARVCTFVRESVGSTVGAAAYPRYLPQPPDLGGVADLERISNLSVVLGLA